MSRIKFFLVPKRLQILTISLVIFVFIWLSLPGMTEDMSVRPWYYLWTKGLFPLNKTVLSDFSRDSEYRKILMRKPVEVLVPLFSELTKASDYNSSSERYKYLREFVLNKKGITTINMGDIYWLSGNTDYASG